LLAQNGNQLEVCGEASGDRVSDATLVRKILINLLGNAAKFTRNGRFTLGYRIDPAEACFQVIDTGIGIAAADQQRIFEAFVQGDASESRSYGGAGLGLTLCARFCRRLGGHIELTSESGVGSTFTVRLPDLAAPRQSDKVA
jgi:signal transduction histidine kinase